MDILNNVMNYLAVNGTHMLGTLCVILVLSAMIAGLLKLNYKDLWVSKEDTYVNNDKLASSHN